MVLKQVRIYILLRDETFGWAFSLTDIWRPFLNRLTLTEVFPAINGGPTT